MPAKIGSIIDGLDRDLSDVRSVLLPLLKKSNGFSGLIVCCFRLRPSFSFGQLVPAIVGGRESEQGMSRMSLYTPVAVPVAVGVATAAATVGAAAAAAAAAAVSSAENTLCERAAERVVCLHCCTSVSYTHLTLPTIYSV